MNLNNLKEILEERSKYQVNTQQWLELNALKNHALSKSKPSTNEVILYFDESDLADLPVGYIKHGKALDLFKLPQQFASRFTKEHDCGLTRHPIPYIIIKFEDKYFYIVREQGSGESRLVGKVGVVGGHIGVEDKGLTMLDTIVNGLMRELEEEVGVKDEHIKNAQVKGYIRSNDGVDQDHFGIIYEIELNTDNIKSEEDGIISGLWINKNELPSYYEKMENWSRIVYDNIIK